MGNAIFSLISKNEANTCEIIQNIIVCDNYAVADQLAKLTYGADAFAVETTLYKVTIGNYYINGQFYTDNFELIAREKTESETISELENKIFILEKLNNDTIDVEACTLDELKKYQVRKSKSNLKDYLENAYVTSTCHGEVEKNYSVTDERQAQLNREITLAKGDENYLPSWNATGEVRTYDWTIAELSSLAYEIDEFVKPLVTKQQQAEKDIYLCETKEEVLAVNITFA